MGEIIDRWVQDTGILDIVVDQVRARRIGFSIYRNWTHYRRTGKNPWTGENIHDYTFFFHEFAQRQAGKDEGVYQYLNKSSRNL